MRSWLGHSHVAHTQGQIAVIRHGKCSWLFCMSVKLQISVRYLMSSPQQKPLNDLLSEGMRLQRLKHRARFHYLTEKSKTPLLLFAYNVEISKYLTPFDRPARSQHGSTDVDSTLPPALSFNMFRCELPSHPSFSAGEFKSGLCMCARERETVECCICIWREGAHRHTEKVSVSDTHTHTLTH